MIEFFLEPGAWLRNEHLQQHYLSANYTHVARDAIASRPERHRAARRAPPAGEAPAGVLSLGSNPDLTADLLPQIAAMRASGQPFALIGQMHRELPFMYGDALVAADTFDFLVEDPGTPLFCPPNLPIPPAEHAIALNVSTLMRDGGTLQLGIGELGDAHRVRAAAASPAAGDLSRGPRITGLLARHRRLIETEGGTAPFERGLYGCSEMLVDGFLDLYRSGILKRRVYPSARCSGCSTKGTSTRRSACARWMRCSAAGMSRMSYVDFHELRDVGVFRDDVEYERGMLIAPDGTQLRANFDDPEQRAADRRTLPRRAPAQRRAGRRRILLRTEGFLRRAARLAGRRSAGCSRCAASASSTSCTATSGN